MKSLFAILAISAVLFSFSGCKKEEAISAVPDIKFVSFSPATAQKYVDEIEVTIEYTDGDGDLGENTPDVKNLFCTDSRNNVTYEFRISQLAPDEAKIIIKGQLKFHLPPQGFIDDNNTTETTTYSIYVKDRAGNQSNTVQTSTLTINR
ncbi:MAG TPA: hypothetical protein VK174_01085 [Chitinophagales bacterium]|nr:hypothetical protein [Chitinophagales bacterium]HLP53130.1 hypothetical protein [Chitinophagales bacterium]